MTFYSIDKLLNVILAQPQWEKQRSATRSSQSLSQKDVNVN